MRKTTLTLATPVFYPELPGGFRQFYHYAAGLRERGVEMRVVCLQRRPDEPAQEEVNGIRLFQEVAPQADHYAERESLLTAALQRAAAGLADRRQVVQPVGINWTMARQLRDARAHGLAATEYVCMAPELPEAWLPRLRLRLSTGLLFRAYERVIFCSTAQAALYRQAFRLPASRIDIVPNGVRTDRFRPAEAGERGDLRRQLGLAPDELVFCYVGNIIERKGIDLLVRAWRGVQARHPKARLLLVGQRTMPATFRTPELQAQHAAFEARLDAALTALDPQAPPVRFQPPTDRVEDWLRASDAFVFPSLCEGLPNALLEAMACGLPCITAPFAGFPLDGAEIGHRDREYVLAEHREQDWTDAISALAADPDRRRALGQAAQRWVEKHHAFEKILDALADAYHRAAALPR